MRLVMLEAPREVEARKAPSSSSRSGRRATRRTSGSTFTAGRAPLERWVELFRAVGVSLMSVRPGPGGALGSGVPGITLRTVDGKLEITWDGGSATV